MYSEEKRVLLIRAECTNKNMGILLPSIIEAIHCAKENLLEKDSGIQIWEYTIPLSQSSVDIIGQYKKILTSKTAPQEYLQKHSITPTISGARPHVILDFVYRENTCPDTFEEMQDTVFLQYLLLILNRIADSNISFNVFISKATGSLNSPHSPLLYSTVAKMRTFLSFCAQSATAFPDYFKLLEHIRVLYQYEQHKEPQQEHRGIISHYWNPLFSDAQDRLINPVGSEPIGRIVPFIPITKDTYDALKDFPEFESEKSDKQEHGIPSSTSIVKVQLSSLFENYLERYVRLLPIFRKLQSIDCKNKPKQLLPQLYLEGRELELLGRIREGLASRIREKSPIAEIDKVSADQRTKWNRLIASVQDMAWDIFLLRLMGIRRPASAKQMTVFLISKLQLSKVERDKLGENINQVVQDTKCILDNCVKKNALILMPIHNRIKPKVEQLQKLIQSDSILERLLFMATLFYLELSMGEDKEENSSVSHLRGTRDLVWQYLWGHNAEDDISLLHECCIDYAQGIFQLIENAWFHAIKPDDDDPDKRPRGCGGLTIRVRKKDDMRSFLAGEQANESKNGSKAFGNVPYFLELYITDIQFTHSEYGIYHELAFSGRPFESIVKVLCKNVLQRAKEIDDEGAEPAKTFIQKNLDGVELESLLNSNVPFYTNKITLRHLFGADESTALTEYLQNEANIAYHYGLQILSNVVETGNGYLMVRSGPGQSNYFSSENNNYRPQTFDWNDGTAYILFLPVSLKQQTNYQDTLSVINDVVSLPLEKQRINLKSVLNVLLEVDSPQKKSNAIQAIRQLLQAEMDHNQPNSVFIIDCSDYRGTDYEILAKAVFFQAAYQKESEPSFALINVRNRNEVVKLFRQFALFYNRQGECPVISESSAFFIVDKNAEMDILLCGGIKTINENLYLNQIYGGLDSRAMLIMAHLGKRGTEK